MPLIFLAVNYDPLERGLVGSLRRPDRNTTGVYLPQNEMVAKRVEIMREILPVARRFLVLADAFSKHQIAAATLSALALKLRLPTIGVVAQQVAAGFLLSLNADAAKATRRVAEIGARILKGAKPADIPVEQADEFELVINAKTARSLGVKIPESVMARATRIIQ